MTLTRTARILGVTLFIGALGGLAGALGGALLAAAVMLAVDVSPEAGPMGFIFAAAAGVGCGFGVIVGPALSWLFLRHVPIGRAIAETALAAGVAATLTLVMGSGLTAVFAWSLAASALAAIRLRRAYPLNVGSGAAPTPTEPQS